jgi:hypothetical protein
MSWNIPCLGKASRTLLDISHHLDRVSRVCFVNKHIFVSCDHAQKQKIERPIALFQCCHISHAASAFGHLSVRYQGLLTLDVAIRKLTVGAWAAR